MNNLKYIVTDDGSFSIFSASQTHRDVAKGMTGTPVGAGFIVIEIGWSVRANGNVDTDETKLDVHCLGESISLGVPSRFSVDDMIINRQINRY